MKQFLLSISIFLFVSSYGQTPSKQYQLFIQKADSCYSQKDYKTSAFLYSSAFKTLGNKGLIEDRYKAAKAWSMAETPDSAFDCLQRIVYKRFFNDYNRIKKEKDLENLHSDKRWKPLLDSAYAIKDVVPFVFYQSQESSFTLKNNLKEQVYLYWVDHNHEIFYFLLEPKQEIIQKTYLGHKWLIRRKKDLKLTCEFVITNPNQKFDTKGEIIK